MAGPEFKTASVLIIPWRCFGMANKEVKVAVCIRVDCVVQWERAPVWREQHEEANRVLEWNWLLRNDIDSVFDALGVVLDPGRSAEDHVLHIDFGELNMSAFPEPSA